jgi:hypothetical protein
MMHFEVLVDARPRRPSVLFEALLAIEHVSQPPDLARFDPASWAVSKLALYE